ncbi:MAG: prepilin-type N-terminal cleavage/methylation domain-containing protein [Clostridium sp.]
MKKRGFTLIEALVGVIILSITIIGCVKFYKSVSQSYSVIDKKGESSVNLQIAHEFTVSKVQEASDINLLGHDYLIDGNRIFVQNGTLRYITASQHIAPNISEFKIEHVSNNLYRITTGTTFERLSTIVKRGEIN